MSREQMLYQIYYSYRLHALFGVLTGRIDRTLSFLLLLFGSSVMGNIGYPVIIGFSIAAITAIKMAFTFETTSESARKQAMLYLNLMTSQALTMPLDDLASEIKSIQKNDLSVWHSLVNPSELRTRITLGEPSDIRLSKWEKFLAFLAGDLPTL